MINTCRLSVTGFPKNVALLGVFLALLLFIGLVDGFGQTETATLSGTIIDQSGAFVPDVQVTVTNEDTNIAVQTKTNGAGLYNVPTLKPGKYRVQVQKEGFKQVDVRELTLNVQDVVNRNFNLQVGGTSEIVQVSGDIQNINTTDATVSTVVDRNFAENLPMNGRSFQSLIDLTPGVVLTASTGQDSGQFSVNGQRANANYWLVDGVSANIGVSSTFYAGNGFGGTLGSFSSQGGTNSLVSVDALQEFRIQTSTYAPEFGRTPGGQISIVTRSGTNRFHGTAFDYLRNDILDANDWFADNAGLRKPEERQNDFGGTFSGPILKDKTFFFFSYEGLRLRLPKVAQTTVPDASFTPGTTNSRQNPNYPALQPYLNAFPLPNSTSPEILCDPTTDPTCPPSGATGYAAFNASFSNRSSLDAYSLRIDHKFNDEVTVFGRYNYSPSETLIRGGNFLQFPLSVVAPNRITTQTTTAGATWARSSTIVNDVRFNYSRTSSEGSSYLDTFGGAVPLTVLPLPNPYSLQDAEFQFGIFSLQNGGFLQIGKAAHQLQRQINLVDSLSVQRGSHSLKFGVDFRRLTPEFNPPQYTQSAYFNDVPSAETGSTNYSLVDASRSGTLLFRNLGVFAQDTWRILPRLTLTYGLRWDIDFVPSSINGPSLAAAVNFTDPATLALAPPGTPAFKTPYWNIAPRFGLAYQVSQNDRWQTVLRGGFGVFYDLVSSEVGNGILWFEYPFGVSKYIPGVTFPLADPAPPTITFAGSGWLAASNPHLQLPYTLGWNIALEQALGKQQTVSVSYVGAAGRRLIQTEYLIAPNPSVQIADLTINGATSDYDALQVQFQRRLSRGLQVLSSYTWSHSIDTASAGSWGNASNIAGPFNANANRGSSDFDIRNAFSAAVTYDVPNPKINAFANVVLGGWSVQNILQARSAPPVDISDATFFAFSGGFYTNIRPDVVPKQPFYLYGSQYPGGKAFNPAAFADPPIDPNTGNPLRQGNLSRNVLRGFGATQWDFAIHREFPIRESLKLQFRAEMFNILNHPNFGPPSGQFGRGGFGVSAQMLGQSLAGSNAGGGAFDPLYQIGGPRSIQLALKLTF
jgi:hypothetical protein